ncbi:MAG TPA: hypothetical protein VK886_16430 [Vicinamibacterales bacterium]|nr:hypothetical protein [Vicinamibacterales bacterium]
MGTAELYQPSFWRRLTKGVALLAAGAAAHIWVVPAPSRAPRVSDEVMPPQTVVQERAAARAEAIGTSGILSVPAVDAGASATDDAPDDLVTLRTAAVSPNAGVTLRPAALSTSALRQARQVAAEDGTAPKAVPNDAVGQAATESDTGIAPTPTPLVSDNATRMVDPTREYAIALEASNTESTDRDPNAEKPDIVMARRMEAVADLSERAIAVPPPSPSVEARSPGAQQEEVLVQRLLQQYRAAYERLDAEAAKVVWPSVDERALGSAFRQLAGQRLTFESCGISVSGAAANARCRGTAEYLPKVGSRQAYVASGEWVFDLAKHDSAWHIVSAKVK